MRTAREVCTGTTRAALRSEVGNKGTVTEEQNNDQVNSHCELNLSGCNISASSDSRADVSTRRHGYVNRCRLRRWQDTG